MSIISYDVDDRVRLGNHSSVAGTEAFTTVGGVVTDPTAVTLVVKEPDGTSTTYTWPSPATLSKESTGRFYVDVTLDLAGRWAYRLTGTGAVVSVAEGELHVRRSGVT